MKQLTLAQTETVRDKIRQFGRTCMSCAMKAGGRWKPCLDAEVRRGTCPTCNAKSVVLIKGSEFTFQNERTA